MPSEPGLLGLPWSVVPAQLSIYPSIYLSIYLSLSLSPSHPTREAAAVESSTSLGVILRWSPRSRALSSRSTAAAPPTSPEAGGPRTRAEEAHHTWLGLGLGLGLG